MEPFATSRQQIYMEHHRRLLTCNERKEKERKSIYVAPFIYYEYLKALRHGSHSFTCKYTMLAFPS